MAEFFAGVRPGRAGLALFLNAGDPPLDALTEVVRALDECGVDCLELAVPFPDSVTDGPVIRRSAGRALANGTGLDDVLAFTATLRPELRHLRIALLADWSYTVRPLHHEDFVRRVAESGVDGLLVHGLPPRLRAEHLRTTTAAALPIVTTCYATSDRGVRASAAEHASAYLYVVAAHGRSGHRPVDGYTGLSPMLAELRRTTTAPIAVGFGVRSARDVAALIDAGADAAVVGSAAVAVVEAALDTRGDIAGELTELVQGLHGTRQ